MIFLHYSGRQGNSYLIQNWCFQFPYITRLECCGGSKQKLRNQERSKSKRPITCKVKRSWSQGSEVRWKSRKMFSGTFQQLTFRVFLFFFFFLKRNNDRIYCLGHYWHEYTNLSLLFEKGTIVLAIHYLLCPLFKTNICLPWKYFFLTCSL